MVNIEIDFINKKIIAKGHTDTIACARVSNTFQVVKKLFLKTISVKYAIIKAGRSEIEFTKEGESLFLEVVEILIELEKMYQRNIKIKGAKIE